MKTIYFDVETIPAADDVVERLMPRFDCATVPCGRAGAGAAHDTDVSLAEREMRQALTRAASLNAVLGRVAAIGVLAPGWQEVRVIGVESEAATLEEFWEAVTPIGGNIQLAGFHGARFDFPFMVERSRRLGLQVPLGIERQRNEESPLNELLHEWQRARRQAEKSMEVTAALLGLDGSDPRLAEQRRRWPIDRARAMMAERHGPELVAMIAGTLWGA